jgi:hypothetical protein
MKKLLLFILTTFICANAQNTSLDSISTTRDSVNIRQLVQDQINKVQEIQNTSSVKQDNSNSPTSYKEDLSNGLNDSLSSGLKYKFSAIILAMIISAFYLVLKRKKATKNNNHKSIRKNISSLRAEKPIIRARSELSIIRTNLKKNAVFLSPHEREISKSAKELKIAKGELYLAAELKSLELTKIGNNKTKMVEML